MRANSNWMNVNKNWYWRWTNALSSDFCDLVIKETDWEKSYAGRIGDGDGEFKSDTNFRSTDITWNGQLSPVGTVLQAYIIAANQYAGWNFKLSHMEEVQMGKYAAEKSGCYDWHFDIDMPTDGHQRKLTGVILLSDPKDFDGGNLEIKDSAEEQLLQAKGSIIVFPCYMAHRVTTVTRGIRYSAVSWMRGPVFS